MGRWAQAGRCSRALLLGSRLAALAVAITPGGLLLATPASAGVVQRAFSDTDAVPNVSTITGILQAQQNLCRVKAPRKPVAIRRLSTALANADILLARHSSREKVARLLGRPGLERKGNSVAVAGLATGRPGAALVGFLAAHRASPADPLPLLDAAVILSDLGDQQDALALVDTASRLRDRGNDPYGVSVRVLISNARGVIFFRLGRFAAAERQFRNALQGSPGLAPAERNLAAALLCRGRIPQAVTAYAQSVHVDSVNPDDALDLSQGVPGALPKLTIPPTADDGAASSADLGSAAETAANDVQEASSQETQSEQAWNAELGNLERTGVGRLTARREVELDGLWEDWLSHGDLGALYDQVEADYNYMSSNSPSPATDEEIGAAVPHCWGLMEDTHAAWVPKMRSYDADVRAFAAALYLYATGLANNTRSAALAATITANAKGYIFDEYNRELGVLYGMASYEQTRASECHPPNSGTAAGEQGNGALPDAELCPPELSSINISIDLGIFDLAVSCDGVEMSAEDETPLTPYASFEYKFRDGSTSAFVGMKGGYDIADGVNLSSTAGVYMEWDASGNPTDVGVKVTGPSISAEHLGVDVGGWEGQVSLAPILLD